MSGLSSLVKLVKSGVGPDELAEMLSAMGIEASFETVPDEDKKPEFEALWLTASLPGAAVMHIGMKMKDGSSFKGLLVLSRPENKPKIPLDTKSL